MSGLSKLVSASALGGNADIQNFGPKAGGFAITPSDSVNLTLPALGIYVGGTGDIALLTLHDEVLSFKSVQAGTVLPWAAKRINATGTTATFLIGGYD